MNLQDNLSQLSSQNSIRIVNQQISMDRPVYNLQTLPKSIIPNLTPNQQFIDQQFKLSPIKQHPHIKTKRLSDLYPPNTSLFHNPKQGQPLQPPTPNRTNMPTPSYIPELNILACTHFWKLIDPPYINNRGFYYVSVWRNGVMGKEIVDDMVYFDERAKRVLGDGQGVGDGDREGVQGFPWVIVVVKMWAKLNQGYDRLRDCQPFEFIRAFSFPDWEIMNPNKQKKQHLIAKLAKATNKTQFLVAKTKNDPMVGEFGCIPNCSYIIKGHYQQYGDIYIKILSVTLGGWNSAVSNSNSPKPEQKQNLAQNQFLMPIEQFLNIFHLIYSTNNKYSVSPALQISSIGYQKYTINVDALQKDAITLGLNIEGNRNSNSNGGQYKESVPVGISFYFPHVRVFDLEKKLHGNNQLQGFAVPWSKIMIGRSEDPNNAQVNFMESMRESLMRYSTEGHMGYNIHKNNHQFVYGTYFRGYANDLTTNLALKPGKYVIRLKIEHISSQYRCFASAVTIDGSAKFYDPKLEHTDQVIFLQDCLFRKAILDKKNVTFVNPAKRGSWISCRNEFENLGYSYIAVHVVKNPDNKIHIKISPKVLKQNGYQVKQHKDLKDFQLIVDSEENALIVIKHDKEWKGTGKRIWPPPGIEFSRIPRAKKISEKGSMDIHV